MNTAVHGPLPGLTGAIRDEPCSFWGFRASTITLRRWQHGSYKDEPGHARQHHGMNTAPIRMIKDRPGLSRQSDGPTRTTTASTRTIPDCCVHRSGDNRVGSGNNRIAAVMNRVGPGLKKSSRLVTDCHGRHTDTHGRATDTHGRATVTTR